MTLITDPFALRTDPITNREISTRCWDGFHEPEHDIHDVSIRSRHSCFGAQCKCMCHDYDPLNKRGIEDD